MPYYLWQQRLVSSVSLVTEKELKSRIGFCEIGHNPTYRSAGNSSDMCRDPCNGYVCPAGWSTAAGRSDRCRCSCRRRDQQGSRASGQAAPLSRASITSVPAQPNQPHIHAPSASAPAAALCPAQLPCNRRFACPPGFIVTARQDDPCKCKCALPGELAWDATASASPTVGSLRDAQGRRAIVCAAPLPCNRRFACPPGFVVTARQDDPCKCKCALPGELARYGAGHNRTAT